MHMVYYNASITFLSYSLYGISPLNYSLYDLKTLIIHREQSSVMRLTNVRSSSFSPLLHVSLLIDRKVLGEHKKYQI